MDIKKTSPQAITFMLGQFHLLFNEGSLLLFFSYNDFSSYAKLLNKTFCMQNLASIL